MNQKDIAPTRWPLYGALILAVSAAGLFLFFGHSDRPPGPLVLPAPTPAPGAPPPPASFEAPPSVPVAAPSVPSFAPAGTMIPPDEMRANLVAVRTMLGDFRTLDGANPVGTNAEIMKEVMGDNKKHAKLGPPDGQHLNAEGELLDPWGTPYFFHQLSAAEMEIRSAGPDRVLWTDDDQILK